MVARISIEDAIFAVLKEHGKPMHRNLILLRARGKGAFVPGETRPAAQSNIGSRLSSDSRFVNVGKGLWELETEDA